MSGVRPIYRRNQRIVFVRERLAAALRAKRGARTITACSVEVGVSLETFRRSEQARHDPSVTVLALFCAWLGQSPNRFFDFAETSRLPDREANETTLHECRERLGRLQHDLKRALRLSQGVGFDSKEAKHE